MIDLQIISIVIEVIVVCFGLAIAVRKKRWYGWGIAITFGIYVYYDLARYFAWGVGSEFLERAFFLASLSALGAIWGIYKRR